MRSQTTKSIYDLFDYLPSMVVPSVLGVIAVAFYTRFLPPEEFGFYALLSTTALIIQCFAYNWLFQSIIRYYERYRYEDINRFFSTCFYAYVFVSLLCAATVSTLIAITGDFLSPRAKQVATYLPIFVICQAGLKFTVTFFRAMRKGTHYSFTLSLDSIIKLAVSFLLIYFFRSSADAIILGICVSAATLCAYHLIAFSRQYSIRLLHVSKSLLRKFAHFGFPLISLLVISLVITSSDRYLLSILIDSSAVGIYSAGQRIAQAGVWSIVFYLSLPFYPAIVESFENDERIQTIELMHNMLCVYLVILIPAIAGISVLAEDIVAVILGQEYQSSLIVLPWIAAAVFFNGLSGYYVKSFELFEKTSRLPFIYTGPAILNLILNFILIPTIGMQGAAIATFLSFFCLFVILWASSKKYISWRFPIKAFLHSFFAAAVMCLVILVLPDSPLKAITLLYKIVAGFVVYTAMIVTLDKKILISSYELLRRRS